MCGILGQWNKSQPVNPTTFKAMRDTMRHRGPDGKGFQSFQQGKVMLGHRRLAILDLTDKGVQPMGNEDGTLWISFNGEIYNYLSLREELEALGHRFQSKTDTEVILHGYEQWGRKVLDRLRGMFAFGLWDDARQILFLARDRFGIKPLYYFEDEERFVFASEIKGIVTDPSIPRDLDLLSVGDFFVYRFIPTPRTIWQKVCKLPPGHYMIIGEDSSTCAAYWTLKPHAKRPHNHEIREQVGSLMDRSVTDHLVSDVDLGVFLSGGMDSSVLLHLMHQKGYAGRSFTIGFQDWHRSEDADAQLVAGRFSASHTERMLNNDIISLTEKLAYFFDEPLGGTSFLPTYLVSELASETVKAVVAGDGGDEVFAGYTRYQHDVQSLNDTFTKESVASLYGTKMAWGGYSYLDLEFVLDGTCGEVQRDRNDTWLYERIANTRYGLVKEMQMLDFATFLPEVILAKVDRASMANSLEVRVPFLDHVLVEYMSSLAEESYFHIGSYKPLLKDLYGSHLPARTLAKKKQGFGCPVKQGDNLSVMSAALIGGALMDHHIVQPDAIQSMIDRKARKQLWPMYIFEMWCRCWG